MSQLDIIIFLKETVWENCEYIGVFPWTWPELRVLYL